MVQRMRMQSGIRTQVMYEWLSDESVESGSELGSENMSEPKPILSWEDMMERRGVVTMLMVVVVMFSPKAVRV
jgi:hypothetical protein